ncbi:MAG: methionyl-tRNA formyltransferase [Candidatus Azotimanducaceae bacterium]|jgi:methionyl-tRNA formyltransferase
MKIGYFADGPWSHKAIKLICDEADIEIVFITPRYDTQDPVLRKWAEELGVPFLVHENVNSAEFLQTIKSLGADLLVSMSFNQILRKEIIDLAPFGFINCHAGALPFYRGRNPLNWVLINGESHFGITVHYVDEGVDTGDILRQTMYEIVEHDDYGTLLVKAVDQCGLVLLQAIRDIRDNTTKRLVQATIHPVGAYFGRRLNGDEILDWSASTLRCFNFVRGVAHPGPGARTFRNQLEYAILAAELIPAAPDYIATTGEVVGVRDNGVVVKTGSSTLLITQVARIDPNGAVGPSYVPRFRVGTRLNPVGE